MLKFQATKNSIERASTAGHEGIHLLFRIYGRFTWSFERNTDKA